MVSALRAGLRLLVAGFRWEHSGIQNCRQQNHNRDSSPNQVTAYAIRLQLKPETYLQPKPQKRHIGREHRETVCEER